jgi:hypothetical protein
MQGCALLRTYEVLLSLRAHAAQLRRMDGYQGTRAVVLGGAGFVGSHLCERLLEEGATTVIAVDNLITGSERNLFEIRARRGFRFLHVDVCERPIPVGAEVHFVFNLASPASPVDYARLPIETLRTGSIGTENGLRLAREKRAVFLQASTSEIYGDPLVHPQREDYRGKVNPTGPRSCYDEAKRVWRGDGFCVSARVRPGRHRPALESGRLHPLGAEAEVRGGRAPSPSAFVRRYKRERRAVRRIARRTWRRARLRDSLRRVLWSAARFPELAKVVPAPGPERSVRLQCHGV